MSPLTRPLFALALAATLATPAAAQVQRQPRDYRGLFGGNNEPPTNQQQSLDLNFALYGGYDDNVTADQASGSFSDPRLAASSGYGGGYAGLDYNRRAQKWALGASASTNVRYYTDLDDPVGLNHGAGIGFTYRFSEHTSINASQNVAYLPYFQVGLATPLFQPEPGDQVFLNPDTVVMKRPAWNYGTNVGFTKSLSARSSFTAGYNRYATDYDEENFEDLASQYANARYSYSFSKGLSLRLGYGYRRGRYSPTDDTNRVYENHDVDTGIDYGRSFSFSRRTTLGFSVGSTILRSSGAFGINGESNTRYDVVGSVNLNHQIGRTWTASATYNRTAGYQPGFAAPVFGNFVTAGLSGFWGPRVTPSAGVSWSHGTIGLDDRVRNSYDTFSAYSSLQYALTGNMALEGRYFYYHYNFDNRLFLPDGLMRDLDRNGVQVGLVFWLPVLR